MENLTRQTNLMQDMCHLHRVDVGMRPKDIVGQMFAKTTGIFSTQGAALIEIANSGQNLSTEANSFSSNKLALPPARIDARQQKLFAGRNLRG